jgi:hypothetical protein
MADFCKQCSLDHFGKDYKELANLTSKENWEQGLAACTICEGCGIIQVTPDGECCSDDCLQKGKQGHGKAWLTC